MRAGAATYAIAHPLSADALIDEREFEADERLPYWADLWPSAIALARHLAARDLAGLRAVELGCGVGLPSTVALARGAYVLATDHYEAALAFARHNARANTGRELRTAILDWHVPRLGGIGSCDLVLAADVLYERRNVGPLAALVPNLLGRGGEMVLADPRRVEAPSFLTLMRARGFSVESEEAEVEGPGSPVGVMVHRFRRDG